MPQSWKWQVQKQPAGRGKRLFDAEVTVEAPGGERTVLLVEAKRLVKSRDVPALVEQMRSRSAGQPGAIPMVVARYLPPTTRERLERAGVAYADATGNRRLAVERPAIFIRNVGADRDPWRGRGRPRGTLKGAPAARVVRWLADVAPPYTMLEVARASGASTGATYRVVRFLEEEGLVEREPRGPITRVEWRSMIQRWSRDYSFPSGAGGESLLFPRGLETLLDELRAAPELPYVLTGSLAARRYAAHAPARFAMLYAGDVDAVIERLGLRRVDAGANVLVAPDREDVAFARAETAEGLRLAAPSQIAVDLLTGPGRSPSEGEALLDWMEAHESEWRR
ncbi:MAG TPA: helix-turn-helix domain-containing protein [Thermoanaerobaculia bacterium]|nr:helix-turn-helix domain-containing protein [Thermoanaerobaculia bacterium]